MRILVRALLPLGEGTILDPFMGSGSTIAAAEAVGYASTGLEIDAEYFHLAERAIPRLAALYPQFKGQAIEIELNGNVEAEAPESQLALTLAERPPAYGRPGS
jgi:tRNA G10  N-methylase Trm11